VALCIVATVTVGLLLINTYRLYEIERHFEDGATSFTPNWSIFSTKDDHNHPKIPTPGNVPPKMPPKGHDPRRRSNNRVTKSPSTKKPRSAIRRMFDSLNGAIRNHPIKVCGVAATAVYCAQTMGYLQPEGAQLPKQKGGASLRTQGPSPVETFVKDPVLEEESTPQDVAHPSPSSSSSSPSSTTEGATQSRKDRGSTHHPPSVSDVVDALIQIARSEEEVSHEEQDVSQPEEESKENNREDSQCDDSDSSGSILPGIKNSRASTVTYKIVD